jgi:hypothetical protein
MKNYPPLQILALVILSSLFTLHCSYSRPTSLRVRVRLDSGSVYSMSLERVAVHLLDVDPINLVLTGSEEHTEVYRAHPRLKVLAGVMNARRQAAYSLGPDVFLFLDQSRPLWEPHVIKSMQTDAEGDARLDDLKPGSYWLMGYSEGQEREAFWIQQIMVKVGDNEIVLEPGNALYIK